MLRPLLSLLTAVLFALALPGAAHAELPVTMSGAELVAPGDDATPAADTPAPAKEEEKKDPTFAEQLKDFGIELEADEQAAVDAYSEAGADAGFSWPTKKVDGEDKSINQIVIEKINAKNDTNSFWLTSNLWIMICAALVFLMHLGFATLESGLTQSKNTVNILFKNTFIICLGLLTYAAIGFNLMYPCGNWIVDSYFPAFVPGIGVDRTDPSAYLANMTSNYHESYTWFTDFIFQGMFAATAATIISGCVAERIKLLPFLIFTTIYVAFLYPILGSWHWGGGWLSEKGFTDFAGSTLVHSVGGWGGLAAILVLGPRKGKYVDGQIRPILPSNLPLAAMGVFLLWLGWFGFNGGSVLSASGASVSYVLVTTSIAAAAGGLAAGAVSWIFGRKPDLTMALNGILAGLVGITASPDICSLWATVFIGVSSGVIVYFSVLFFDKMKIDDPVGALSVHLVCGIWGTLLAVLGGASFGVQLTGVIAYGMASFAFALVTALIVKAIFGWRVSEEEELEGLDVNEHGVAAYHGLGDAR